MHPHANGGHACYRWYCTNTAYQSTSLNLIKLTNSFREFKIRSDRLFLTLPQTKIASKQVLADKLLSLDPTGLTIAEETHGDGGRHFHALATFAERRQFTNSSLRSLLGEQAHIETARSLNKVAEYLSKEDTKPFRYGIAKRSRAGSTETASSRIASILIDGGTLDDAIAADRGYCLLHYNAVEGFYKHVHVDPQPTLKQWSALRVLSPIATWLNTNMLAMRIPRQLQLWIYGPPAIGKSHLASALAQYFRIYYPPYDEAWTDGYADAKFDLIIFDEYKSQKKICWMNQFIAGHPMPLSRRGREPVLKQKPIPVIVLSNFHPRDCYKNCAEGSIDAFVSRFEIVLADKDMLTQVIAALY